MGSVVEVSDVRTVRSVALEGLKATRKNDSLDLRADAVVENLIKHKYVEDSYELRNIIVDILAERSPDLRPRYLAKAIAVRLHKFGHIIPETQHDK